MAYEVENFLAQNLLKAVQAENFECAKILIQKHNANPYCVVRENGIAPIHFAVGLTNEKAAEQFTQYFLKCSGDPNVKTEDSETPLHIACYYGRLRIVKLIMSNGGDISIKDADGNTALNITINQGHFEIFDYMKQIIYDEKSESKIKESQTFTVSSSLISPKKLFNADKPTQNSYNLNVVNTTHRRKPSVINQQRDVQLPEVEEEANVFELNMENLEEFQKRNSSVSRMSLINTWKDQVQKADIEINFEEILNKFSNDEASSTKVSKDVESRQVLDSFHTANTNHLYEKSHETSFIKSPKSLTNGTEQYQVVEDYRHIDRENGLVFFERKIEPCISKHNSLSSQASTKFTVPSDYNTVDLRRELTQFGDSPGPITKSTKYLYMKRLMRYKRDPSNVNIRSDREKICFSIELEKALRENVWQETLVTYAEANLETKVNEHFMSLHFHKEKCREGHLKTSFIYLLIDPRLSENLPTKAKDLDSLAAWRLFLSSIFYVGKGKSSRPYSHLYDAIKLYQRQHKIRQNDSPALDNRETDQFPLQSPSTKPVTETEKLTRIIDIWNADKGVVCLHVFHNLMPVEAYTREAAIIDAIGLINLTNLKSGSYHGVANTWTMRDKKQLGTILLFKSLNIFLSEGESQLRPTDIK